MSEYATFYFYNSYYTNVKDFYNEEQMMEYLKAIVLYGTTPNEDVRHEVLLSVRDIEVRKMFAIVHRQIDASIGRYERAVSNGKKGGRKSSVNKIEMKRLIERNPSRAASKMALADYFHCSERTISRHLSDEEMYECIVAYWERKRFKQWLYDSTAQRYGFHR
jgi:hypothetical protein